MACLCLHSLWASWAPLAAVEASDWVSCLPWGWAIGLGEAKARMGRRGIEQMGWNNAMVTMGEGTEKCEGTMVCGIR